MPTRKSSTKVIDPFAQAWASGDDLPDKETYPQKDAQSTPEDLRGDKNPFASPDSGVPTGSTTSANTTTSDTDEGSSVGEGSTVDDKRGSADEGRSGDDEEGSDGEMTDSTWGTLTSKSPVRVRGSSRSSPKLDDVLDLVSPTVDSTVDSTVSPTVDSTVSPTVSPTSGLSLGSSVGSVDALRTASGETNTTTTNLGNKTSLGIPVVVADQPTSGNNHPFVMTSPAVSLLGGESPQSSGNYALTDEPQSGIQIIMASPQPTPPRSPTDPQQNDGRFPTELVSLLQNFAHMGKTPNEDPDEPSPTVVDSSKYLSGDAARVLGEMLLASGTAIVKPVSEAKNGHSITTEDIIKKWAEYSVKGCNQQPCLDYLTNAVKNLREAQQREGVRSSNTYENLELPSKMMFPVRKVTTFIKQGCRDEVRLRPTAAVFRVDDGEAFH